MTDWISTTQASCILDVHLSTVYDGHHFGFRQAVRHQSRSKNGKGSQYNGLRWSREDIEDVKRIMEACRLNCHQAGRVLVARREGLI